ncbi:MAG: hypothetical protein ABL907_02450 [Hyphomicrobium sp.]
MIATACRNALIADCPLKWADAFVLAGLASFATVVSASTVYLTKSALGINLMPGPSPFHDLLYWILV